jgi:hypothetical protein
MTGGEPQRESERNTELRQGGAEELTQREEIENENNGNDIRGEENDEQLRDGGIGTRGEEVVVPKSNGDNKMITDRLN